MSDMNDWLKKQKALHILQESKAPVHDHAPEDAHDEHEAHAQDTTEREHRLNLAEVREKLRGKSGKQYWRTLEELAENPHFEELIHREFPRHASEWDD